jgi:hypothetical protein
MANVQLSERERTAVYIDLDSKRILGFAPENATMVIPPGIRYEVKVLYFAKEIERYVAKFREQQDRDLEEKRYRQVMREAPIRKAIADAIRDRNRHVNQWNRDLNNTFIRLNEERYQKMMSARPETFLAAEAWEEKKPSEDVALENPALNLRPENA